MSEIDLTPNREEIGESRVMTAMITPFDDEGAVNFDVAQDLAYHLTHEGGNDGLILAGTTGESPAMSTETTLQLVRCVREAVGAEVELVVGTGAMITDDAVDKTRRAAAQGIADRFLLVNSPYNRPSPEGVLDYFQRVSDVAQDVDPDFKGIVYNIPGRTGTYIDLEMMRRIAVDMDSFTALKDAAPGPDGHTHPDVLEILGDETAEFAEFDVYSGDDSRNHELYEAGAVGAISVYGHWVGNQLQGMFDAIDSGDTESAEWYRDRLAMSADYESMPWARNPIPARAMMQIMGFDVGPGVSPMVLTEPESKARLEQDAVALRAYNRSQFGRENLGA